MNFYHLLQRGGLLACCLLAAVPCIADTITLTLDDVTVDTCGPTWNEAGVELWFEETTPEDMTPGYCVIVANITQGANEGVYILPARLVVDLTGLDGLETVEVDVYEAHFAGSTRAFLYYQGGQLDYAQSTQELNQTLVLSTGGGDVDRFAVSAHESAVWEVRLSGTGLTPTKAMSFGSVKATYR
jgi:hypothetical protein